MSLSEKLIICTICESKLDLNHIVRVSDYYYLSVCDVCSGLLLNPRPDEAEITKYYPPDYFGSNNSKSTYYNFYNKLKSYKGNYPGNNNYFWKILSKIFGKYFLYEIPYMGENRRLLDIGCGRGDNLIWAQTNSWNVYGVDISEHAVQLAKSKGLKNIFKGSLEDQRFDVDYFDCIIMHQSLEHVHYPYQILKEINRILKMKGTLIITVPNWNSYPRYYLGTFWNALQLPLHLTHFNKLSIIHLLNKSGFYIKKIKTNEFTISLFLNIKNHISIIKLRKKYNVSLKEIFGSFKWNPLKNGPKNQLAWGDILLVISEKNKELN